MSATADDPFEKQPGNENAAMNRRDCPHCGLWFRFDEAKPAGKNSVRCPNCGWEIPSAA
ncbi:MAG: MJ0042-type zinc finger domain-containing protein [Candidatus Omnitrophota bacterium]